MESIGDILRQEEPSKKFINKLMRQAERDAKKDKYTHAAIAKADKLSNNEKIVK